MIIVLIHLTGFNIKIIREVYGLYKRIAWRL